MVVKTAKQIVREVIRFIRSLFNCLGISVSVQEGWSVGVGIPITTTGVLFKTDIFLGYAGGGWEYNPGSGWYGWSYASHYMSFPTIYKKGTEMVAKLMKGESYCVQRWENRQLQIGASVGKQTGLCDFWAPAGSICKSEGIAASTKFPKSTMSYCFPPEYQNVMAAYTLSFSQVQQWSGISVPHNPATQLYQKYLDKAAAALNVVPKVIRNFNPKKQWGFSVAASCCKVIFKTGKLDCGWR